MKNSLLKLFFLLVTLFSCNKEKARMLYDKAYVLEEKMEFEQAIVVLDEVIRLDSFFEQAYLDRAIDKSIIKDYIGAISDLDKLLTLNPNAIEGYTWRAEYKRMLGDYKSAIEDCNTALKLTKNLNWQIQNYLEPEKRPIEQEYILFERGISNFHLKNFEAAIDDLDYCIKKGFNLKTTKFIRGLSLISLGYKNEGCEDLKIAKNLGNKKAVKSMFNYCN